MTILEKRMTNRRGNKNLSEEQNEKFKQDVLANGFKDYRFRLDGEQLTREYRISGDLEEVFVINTAQGGNITKYRTYRGESLYYPDSDPKQVISSWDAEYQKVNKVWIPKKTKYSEVMGDDSLRIKEIEWADQEINQKIPEERFTVKGIGAYQGIEVIDYRLGGKSFYATGDEYPPEYELPTPTISYVRWTFMGIGLLMILFGSISLIYKQIKRVRAKP
jgi:hypothetical protein